ncbi:MAG: NAD(P)-binding domain-containing protein [Chitinophagaceae bacterium]|nr:NAD(P)-binding domain-containing protein [Chitinophagaceae bacterium]
MKIGIIGSGIVGQVLANAFKSEGHEVVLGTRNPDKKELGDFKSDHPSIPVYTFEKTAATAELIVLATAGSGAEEAIRIAGLHNFVDKIVIDTTNPIHHHPPVNGVLQYFTDINNSLMERIQQLLPEAKLVKAFNSVGNAVMYRPSLIEGTPTMFICGNDDEAKKTVTGILTSFGWETEDMGMVESARAIEPLCMLWCIPGFLRNSWSHAFRFLK